MNHTGRIIQRACAIAIIFIMTMADLGFVGVSLISYAINTAQTNNQNIEFKAYFVDGNESLETVAPIDQNDLKVALEVGVKKDGYLSNAKVQLAENSNFKFKTGLKSDYISNIDERTITFKQINEGESKKVEVGIEFTGLQEFDLDYLSRISTINLTGTYVSSKNNNIQINGSAELKLNWTYPENIQASLTSDIITNSTIAEDEANKKIVQALITSKIENNSYPVRDTNISLNIPGTPETVTVHKRTTASTNGDKEFNTSNYTYENGILRIAVQNGQNNKIVWQKNVDDKFVVTIKYPETAEITNSKITANSSITTYNDRVLTKTAEATISENKENYASIKEIETQKEIAKGKIYAGENKEYITKTEVNVDYANILQKIHIEEKEVKALKGEEEKELNVNYKNIVFNKANIQSILGNTWNITIKDQANNSKTISNETEPDENGNIIVQQEAGARNLTIQTSKPENNGILKYQVTKTIMKTEYTREQIKELTKIKDSNIITYTKNDNSNTSDTASNTITLKETESKASLRVEPITLTTSAEQEMHITAVLETNNEYRDLYKNPVVKIKLPKQINKISAQCSLMYGNGLKLEQDGFKIKQENGQEVIIINLTGEQKTYEGEAVNGATLNITARVGLDRLSTNSSEKVIMTYTNENAVSFADEGHEEVNVDIVSQNSMILTNNIEEYNITTLGKENDKEIVLPAKAEAKNATVKMQIVNNEETTISNIAILGKIANVEGKIDRISKIRTNIENSRIYYTSNDNPTTSISNAENNWKETASSDSKYFLVAIGSLENGGKINLSYDINIKADLPHNLETEAFYKVSYTNNLSGTKKEAEATKIIFTTGKVAEIKTSITAKIQGTEINPGDVVKAGEIIEYTTTISNIGRQKIENATITATIPENTTLIELNSNYPGFDEESDSYTYDEPYYIEKSDTQLTKSNSVIDINGSIVLKYMVKVKENLTETKTSTTRISVTGVGDEEKIEEFSNRLEPANLSLNITPIGRDIITDLEKGQRCIYFAEVQNISNTEQRDVEITIKANELIKIDSIEYHSDDTTEEISNTSKTFTINTIKPNDKAVIKIQATIQEAKDSINTAQIGLVAKDKNNSTYRSNLVTDNVKAEKLSAEVTSTTSSKNANRYVEPGDTINYTAKVKNIGKVDAENVRIETMISDYLEIESVTLNGNQISNYYIEPYFEEDNEYSMVVIDELEMKQNEEAIIQIKTIVSDNLPQEGKTLKVSNKVLVYGNIGLFDETKVNEYYIKTENITYGEDNPDNPDPDSPEPDDPYYDPDNPYEDDDETYTITGTVWKDENNDGLRDESEELLDGINVCAINVETNQIATNDGEQITDTTASDGTYALSNLPKGNYIVAFVYDTNKYMVTTYQTDGVDESINSDAVKASRVVNGKERTAAFSDSIEVSEDIVDIDLGLAEAKLFSLKLDKSISKIIVTNKNGSKTYNFDDTDIAKVEIASKELSGATVVIEYKLKVTNVGEVPGYAKSIVDNLPASLTFNSGLNSDWYKKGGKVYTSSLANTLIEPGETEEVTLTLTKKMTESNTGLTNNKAEIQSAYNSLGIPNTTIDKEEQGTVNAGSADAIIGIKTVTAVSYVVLTLTIIIIICGFAYLVNKRLLLDKIEI